MVQIFSRDERKFIHEKLKELKKEYGFNWESSNHQRQKENLSLFHFIHDNSKYIADNPDAVPEKNYLSEFKRFGLSSSIPNEVLLTVIDYICLLDEEFPVELEQYRDKRKRAAAKKKVLAQKKATARKTAEAQEKTATSPDGVKVSDAKPQPDAVPQATDKRLPAWQSIPFITTAGALSMAAGVLALALFWNKGEFEPSLPEGEAPRPFSSKPQKVPMSDRKKAQAKLAARGIPVIYASLKSAVVTADAEMLQLLHAAGMSDSALKKVFTDSKTVIEFFQSSRDSSASLAWFKNIALKIIDVNKLIGTGDDQTSLIYYAMKSSNVGAVRALLENGANPHAYQNLFLSPHTLISFVHPYTYVLRNSNIPTDAKKQLFKLLKKHGAIHIKPRDKVKGDVFALDRQNSVLKKDLEMLKSGFKITPNIQKPVCILDKSRWCGGKAGKKSVDCKIVSAVPKSFSIFGRDYWSLGNVDVMNYIGRYDDKGYFIASLPLGFGLLEVRADLLQMRVYGVIRPGAGMGLCKPFDNDSKYTPERCWRRITIDTVSQDGRISAMSLSNHYKFQIEHCKAAS